MNSKCQCRTHRCEARILTPGGQEIARGLLKLSGDLGPGYFVPVPGSSPRPTQVVQTRPEVVAEVSGHRHTLENWVYHSDVLHSTDEGLILGDYFVFDGDR